MIHAFYNFTSLYNYIDVTDSLRHSILGRLALSSISPLFVDQFGRSLQFCHRSQKFKPQIKCFFLILSDFRELIFCGPWRPCFNMIIYIYLNEVRSFVCLIPSTTIIYLLDMHSNSSLMIFIITSIFINSGYAPCI